MADFPLKIIKIFFGDPLLLLSYPSPKKFFGYGPGVWENLESSEAPIASSYGFNLF